MPESTAKHPAHDDIFAGTQRELVKALAELALTEQRLRDLVEPGSKMRRGLLGAATRDIEKQDDAYWRQFDAALTAARELLEGKSGKIEGPADSTADPQSTGESTSHESP